MPSSDAQLVMGDDGEATPRSGGRGKGGNKISGGKGGGGGGRGGRGRGKGSKGGSSEGGSAVDVSDADSTTTSTTSAAAKTNTSDRGGGGGGNRGASTGGGKGTPRAKPGDTKEMGGLTLVALKGDDGQIKWEPVGQFDSAASREAKRKAEQEELLWLKRKEEQLKDERVREAKEYASKELQRKAQLFGAENVYRTTGKSRGPMVPVPKILLDTREEEERARQTGLDKSAPKQYQVIKEALVAYEKDYQAKELAAREEAYEKRRKRLHLKGQDGLTKGAEVVSEEELRKRRDRVAKRPGGWRMAKGDSDEEEKDPASKPPSFAHAQRETRLIFQAPKTK